MSQVLISDDSLLQCRTLSAIVKEQGHDILTANNGLEALEIIQENKPDCILLDMLMPVMDGLQVLEKMQELNLHIPVIVLAIDIQDWLKQRCLELGAKQFVKKPVKQEELCTALQDIFLVRATEGVS